MDELIFKTQVIKAIEALDPKLLFETEAISRQEVINLVDAWFKDKKDTRTVEEVLRSLPSILPVRRHGRWIPAYREEEGWVMCSECSHEQLYRTNFCSCCGSDNRGGIDG